ncbi:MAG: glycosyltransferase family 2 protein [Bacteroidales bacterium]|nr:glycosyltransferase family 2 protein [Bacteroidales bacterium]
MAEAEKTAVVIPSYKVAKHIENVLAGIPGFIDYIIVVDDKCPQNSGEIAEKAAKKDPRIHVVFHEKNSGVGGAVISGYKKALELKVAYIIKMDGDGQMDPTFIEKLLQPLKKNKADYTKGNRFKEPAYLKNMPRIRLFGNSILSFLLKVCSGYWNVMDPTNGFTAIRGDMLRKFNFEKLSKRYFFESDMLVHLNIYNGVVKDIPMPAIYGDEESSLRIGNILLRFPFQLKHRFIKRILYKYFFFDFNMGSVYTLVGLPLFFFGSIFGIYRWIYGVMHDEVNSTGTVMLAILPIILGIQFILQAIQIDINSVPEKKDEDE